MAALELKAKPLQAKPYLPDVKPHLPGTAHLP